MKKVYKLKEEQRWFLEYVMVTFYYDGSYMNDILKNDKVIMKRVLKEGYYHGSDVETLNEIRASYSKNYKKHISH